MSSNTISKNITIAIIPFILLITIGLIKDNIFGMIEGITLHQKVFKTFLIFIFDLILLFILIIKTLNWKEGINKQRKYLLYFIFYFLFIFLQFIVSFLSKEISYDREYYLANYTFLIIFSMFFFLYLNNLKDVKIGLLIISIFFIIVFIWSTNDFFIARKTSSSFRPSLSFGNTNYFAGYAIGLLPLALISSIVWYNKKRKFLKNWLSIIIFIVGILGTIAIFFTKTRAAFFGCYIGFFVVLIPSLILMIDQLSYNVKIPFAVLFIMLSLSAPVILLKSPPPIINKLFGRLVMTMDKPAFFIKDRINGWTGGLGLFKDHPIFGAGLGTVYPASFKYIGKYYYMYSESNSFKHSHSEYVEVLGESGIFGIIIFFALFGYIIFSLLKRAYSKKYSFDYRLISLGVSAGLISMLIHQIFSLTLRMSVTMTAYFFLLGIGIFLISYSKSALIVRQNEMKKNFLPDFLHKNINFKDTLIIFLTIFLFLIMSYLLFLPLFKSEINVVKFLKDKTNSYEIQKHYIDNAVQIKPDNPYAWYEKYKFDNDILLFTASKGNYKESFFNEAKNDLDKLNSIIPGYQNVWSKYAKLYLMMHNIYKIKFQNTLNYKDLEESKKALEIALEYFNKSLNMNFLYDYDHMYKLLILSEFNNQREYQEAIKDYITAKIYLDFAKPKKIIKENVTVNFNNKTSLEIIDPSEKQKINIIKYNFIISNKDVIKISEKAFQLSGTNNFDKLNSILNEEISSILKQLSPEQ